MKKKENKYRWFWYPFYIILICFVALSIALESGYYESRIHDKVTLTEEQIKLFEEDVKNGKAVDMMDYVVDDYVDYSNTVSRLGQSIGNGIEGFMTEGISSLFDVIGSLIS